MQTMKNNRLSVMEKRNQKYNRSSFFGREDSDGNIHTNSRFRISVLQAGSNETNK